ncbi:hypothetical protein [Swaminathania salitolerans]|uniref:Uncharacterized protein n=1 Tax=Swaminathania salitolerans TaxID=182838 RepID=A0A511BSG3_9PROT|nr:hypothetical protein [Swaminathania salitolerans]GBQ09728.1 hypothetical protein AA21291_0175 [Swaminathania salitolerans LMG 21291]GEL00868.1 hypothetical protein SSA02_00310 [Swaminathania salitolerans]
MFRESLYLVRHGVPWAVVMGWSRARRIAACVVLAEGEGFRFDWEHRVYRRDEEAGS